jgi:hypothetical protein
MVDVPPSFEHSLNPDGTIHWIDMTFPNYLEVLLDDSFENYLDIESN